MPSGAGWKQSSFVGLIKDALFSASPLVPDSRTGRRGLRLPCVATLSFPQETKTQHHLLKGALLLLTRQQGTSSFAPTRF